MSLIKNNLIPTLIILAAAALVIVLALPLAGTEWAESFRTGATGAETEPTGDEARNAPALLMVVLPVLKVALFMGVGGLLTALVRWVRKRIGMPKKKQPKIS